MLKIGEHTSVFKILMRKTARKNSFGKSRHKQEDNTRIYFIEIKVNLRNWIVWISIGIIGKLM